MPSQCDPGDCTRDCAFCGPHNPCMPHDCVYVTVPRLTDAEAIHRIMVAGRGAEEHKRRWQNGFISESAYDAAVETAMCEIQRLLKEAER